MRNLPEDAGVISARQHEEVSTREIASLLAELAPRKLEELRIRFPASARAFEDQYVLGEKKGTHDGATASPTAVPAVRALIHETLSVLVPAMHRVQLGLSRRIRTARRLRLGGSVIATICSAGAMASLTAAQPALAPVASTLALMGGLSMLLGEHFEKPVLGGSKGLSELLGNVLAVEPVIQDIKVRLAAEEFMETGVLMDIARQLNGLAADIKYASLYGAVSLS